MDVEFFLRHDTRCLAGGQSCPTDLSDAEQYDYEMSMIPDLPPKNWAALGLEEVCKAGEQVAEDGSVSMRERRRTGPNGTAWLASLQNTLFWNGHIVPV
jgi:hypothetical protein